METVKLYKITITGGFLQADDGVRYSYTPWAGNNSCYKGYDDGGADYVLPDGYTVDTSVDGTPMIFDPDGRGVMLDVWHGQPAILVAKAVGAAGYRLKTLKPVQI